MPAKQTSLVNEQCHEARADQGVPWGLVPFPCLTEGHSSKMEPLHHGSSRRLSVLFTHAGIGLRPIGKGHWKEQSWWHLPSWGIVSSLVLGSFEVLHIPGPRRSQEDMKMKDKCLWCCILYPK